MNRSEHRSKKLPAILVAMMLFANLITGCAKKTSDVPSTLEATFTVESSPTPIHPTLSPTPPPIPPTQTPEPTAIPVVTDGIEKNDAGLFVMAMGDGKYHHLFAYHPEYLSLTRITSGEYDYDDPAISPDGSSIAYCANQSGKWEIYRLNLLTAEVTQVTHMDSYACAPTWSPDGLWLAYEIMLNNKLGIMLQSTVDAEASPIQLTDDNGNNFDPTWSATGREIAFVSDRTGKLEIWKADLNAAENRLSPLVADNAANYFSPIWSLDGTSLVWSKINDESTIVRENFADENTEKIEIGSGSNPVWATTNNGVAAILHTSNDYELVTYRGDSTRVIFPAILLPDEVTALTWQPGPFVTNLEAYLASTDLETPVPIFPPNSNLQGSESGWYEPVFIADLDAPEPYLSSSITERFSEMRGELSEELGWDFLKILDGAYTSLPSDSSTAIKDDWAYTGRSIKVNLDPLDANWMKVSRDDFNGRTYWHIWLKCMDQDGTCGAPLKALVWDFTARYDDEIKTVEIGGESGKIAKGYWLDFTAFALRYGWERFPADANWRNYYPATNMDLFALTDGLTWQQAMKEIYLPDQIEGFIR